MWALCDSPVEANGAVILKSFVYVLLTCNLEDCYSVAGWSSCDDLVMMFM